MTGLYISNLPFISERNYKHGLTTSRLVTCVLELPTWPFDTTRGNMLCLCRHCVPKETTATQKKVNIWTQAASYGAPLRQGNIYAEGKRRRQNYSSWNHSTRLLTRQQRTSPDLLSALHNLTWSLGAVERWSYEKLRIQTNPEAENGGQSLPMKNKQKDRRRRRMECSARSNIYYRGEKQKN